MAEQAFKGTIKEGFKRKFTVINEADLKKYTDYDTELQFASAFALACRQIEKGRINDGKPPFNNYIVINLDEPYIDEIVEILKRNGHWG